MQLMKRKIVTVIIAAMMMTSITACGTSSNASANESIEDTEQVAVVDTETEEMETEEPTELAESTEELSTTEVVNTETTEEDQVASNDKKTQDASKSSSDSKTTNNEVKATDNSITSTKSTANTSASNTNTTTSAGTASTSTSQQTASSTTHEHVWVEHLATGHYEDQVVTAAYDEPVYEEKVVCGCGGIYKTVEEWMVHQDNTECTYGYSVKDVQTGTTHHDAVTQSVWVEDAAGWYECSVCGERDIRASHNHN